MISAIKWADVALQVMTHSQSGQSCTLRVECVSRLDAFLSVPTFKRPQHPPKDASAASVKKKVLPFRLQAAAV